jgi:hypothetical protein
MSHAVHAPPGKEVIESIGERECTCSRKDLGSGFICDRKDRRSWNIVSQTVAWLSIRFWCARAR